MDAMPRPEVKPGTVAPEDGDGGGDPNVKPVDGTMSVVCQAIAKAGYRSKEEAATMSEVDCRETLLQELEKVGKGTRATLQGMSNAQLVEMDATDHEQPPIDTTPDKEPTTGTTVTDPVTPAPVKMMPCDVITGPPTTSGCNAMITPCEPPWGCRRVEEYENNVKGSCCPVCRSRDTRSGHIGEICDAAGGGGMYDDSGGMHDGGGGMYGGDPNVMPEDPHVKPPADDTSGTSSSPYPSSPYPDEEKPATDTTAGTKPTLEEKPATGTTATSTKPTIENEEKPPRDMEPIGGTNGGIAAGSSLPKIPTYKCDVNRMIFPGADKSFVLERCDLFTGRCEVSCNHRMGFQPVQPRGGELAMAGAYEYTERAELLKCDSSLQYVRLKCVQGCGILTNDVITEQARTFGLSEKYVLRP